MRGAAVRRDCARSAPGLQHAHQHATPLLTARAEPVAQHSCSKHLPDMWPGGPASSCWGKAHPCTSVSAAQRRPEPCLGRTHAQAPAPRTPPATPACTGTADRLKCCCCIKTTGSCMHLHRNRRSGLAGADLLKLCCCTTEIQDQVWLAQVQTRTAGEHELQQPPARYAHSQPMRGLSSLNSRPHDDMPTAQRGTKRCSPPTPARSTATAARPLLNLTCGSACPVGISLAVQGLPKHHEGTLAAPASQRPDQLIRPGRSPLSECKPGSTSLAQRLNHTQCTRQTQALTCASPCRGHSPRSGCGWGTTLPGQRRWRESGSWCRRRR